MMAPRAPAASAKGVLAASSEGVLATSSKGVLAASSAGASADIVTDIAEPVDLADPADDLACMAALLAIDPVGLGGAVWRGPASDARAQWLKSLRSMMPAATPWTQVPVHVGEDRLLGGLDLAATLQAGRRVAQRGLLSAADGGVLLLAMAERQSPRTVSLLCSALDAQCVQVQREGLDELRSARLCVIALDEGQDDEQVSAKLDERLAFRLTPPAAAHDAANIRKLREGLFERQQDPSAVQPAQIQAARERLPNVTASQDVIDAFVATAWAFGVESLRAPLLALRAARALAALQGTTDITSEQAAWAARNVLAPRATRMPAAESLDDSEQDSPPPPPPDSQPDPPADQEATEQQPQDQASLEEQVQEAIRAALPPDLLERMATGLKQVAARAGEGRSGLRQRSRERGRVVGIARPRGRLEGRLNLLATLREAAPWQRLRQAGIDSNAASAAGQRRIAVRSEDFRVHRYEARRSQVTVFVVDASGSAALHRLSEAKGAVELLLADCYVRRDRVALVAFRGARADILLPPTRSLARAKRSLAGLPGGGGTPLAAGIEAAHDLIANIRRGGDAASVVILTDGRANIALDGSAGRDKAESDARNAARRLRALNAPLLVVDTAPRPQAFALQIATEMSALYLPLPHADAHLLNQAVRVAAGDAT